MSVEKNGVTIDYLIDLISSIKSALTNLDRQDTDNHQILSELSETINILTELYKKQNQDQKINQVRLDNVANELKNLAGKFELTSQKLTSENEKINSNISLINEFKKESLIDINKSILTLSENILQLQTDLIYLKLRENHKEMMENVKNKMGKDKIKDKSSIFDKIISFIKHINDSIGTIYKVILLTFIIFAVVLSVAGVIAWQDLKNILSFRFF